jgi:hypothetical protein
MVVKEGIFAATKFNRIMALCWFLVLNLWRKRGIEFLPVALHDFCLIWNFAHFKTSLSIFRSGETASCTVVFILIYYFVMAGVVWFVMLAYSWDIHFKALGTVRDDLSKKTAYFHIISWCLPLVLTIVCLSISVVSKNDSHLLLMK